jgi:signal transduction histidine kinase
MPSKYRSPDRTPVINLRSERQGNHTFLFVSDNGLGISPANQPKIFGMFKRLHDHVEGTGIGLYIVKRMVENAGGSIQVESEIGKGSTFKVCFRSQF